MEILPFTQGVLDHRQGHAGGGERWISWNAAPPSGTGLTYAVGRAVSAAVRAQEEMQEMVEVLSANAQSLAEQAAELDRLRTTMGVDCFFALFTNVFGDASDLFAAGDEACIAKLGLRDQPVRLKGVMSRKKDFIPKFGQMFRQI